MASVISHADTIRRIQGLIVLMCSLPADGKCREILECALALDHGRITPLLCAPGEPDRSRGHQPWLESLWARSDLTPDERRVVEWQNSPENMEAAIRELRSIQGTLEDIWQLQ